VTSDQLLKRVRWVVVGGVTVLFVLVVALVFQIAIRLNNESQVRALLAEQSRLEQILRDAQFDMNYFDSPQFVEDWLRQHLGLGRPGQSIFVRP